MPDETTLVVFRRRLGEASCRTLFARVIEKARRQDLLKGERTIVDGTKVKSHAAERGTIELPRKGGEASGRAGCACQARIEARRPGTRNPGRPPGVHLAGRI
ncbi:MAG: hypothetical protein K6V97_05675 [Actinomycetia bacterium]|nr:hypothetical protein [Actinomycetes bacterium]